jgi:hypothetical protein
MSLASPLVYHSLAFSFLGIERVLYGYVFHFPKHFMHCCKNGTFGESFQKEDSGWKNFMKFGVYVKVFQFGFILYDVFIHNAVRWSSIQLPWFIFGWTLALAGQTLNSAAYKALGAIGVYYGYEMGYDVPRVTSFPYNLGISDPQYWGVLMTVWAIYLGLSVDSLVVPWIETFWYVLSMKLIENQRGRDWLKVLMTKRA